MESRSRDQRLVLALVLGTLFFIGGLICLLLLLWGGGRLLNTLDSGPSNGAGRADSATAEIVVAVSPGMAATFGDLVEQFNAQSRETPSGELMLVRTVVMPSQEMVEASLNTPDFQAIAPDSSLWLNQLDRQWQAQVEGTEAGTIIPIGNRRFGEPTRYAISPIVIAAWESVARDLGWPQTPVGWEDIQRLATEQPEFKWNHPSTNHASGLLATLAEFYAGAGLTRGLTPEAATDPATLEYVRNVESTVRFYGEGEDVILQRLADEGRDFLDAFVTQEQAVIQWNQSQEGERLVAIYPKEGTLWADHPLALLELGTVAGEFPVTDNQRRTYRAFVQYLQSSTAQEYLLTAGYRPADLSISLQSSPSPFVNTATVDAWQPQTTLQIPSQSVVEVVLNVWWYTKRPTNVFLVVDTSGSMDGDKLDLTKQALRSFVTQIRGDRDQVGLVVFSSEVNVVHALQPLNDDSRHKLNRAIDGLRANGQTALVDGTWEAYSQLQLHGDPEAINAIVVMTDGLENASDHNMNDLEQRFRQAEGAQTVIFTIAFGSGADEKLMQSLAEIGGGQFRRAQETDIEELYKIISTYF